MKVFVEYTFYFMFASFILCAICCFIHDANVNNPILKRVGRIGGVFGAVGVITLLSLIPILMYAILHNK